MRYHKDSVQMQEEDRRATALLAWAVSTDSRLSDIGDPVAEFTRLGFKAYTKAAVAALSTSDTAVALLPLATAFLGVTDRESLVGRIEGAVRIPMGAGARLQVGTVEAVTSAEGAEKPVMTITFALPDEPRKVVAQIVVSDSALRLLGSTETGIMQVLASATAAATDAALITALTAGVAPSASATADVLLAAISGGAPVKPCIIGGFDSLLAWDAGTLRDLRDLGVQILISPASVGQVVALDAAGVLLSDGGVEVQTARHASMYLDDGTSPNDETLVSLWQLNLACLRAERWLRVAVRDGAVAFATTGPA